MMLSKSKLFFLEEKILLINVFQEILWVRRTSRLKDGDPGILFIYTCYLFYFNFYQYSRISLICPSRDREMELER